MHRLTRALRTKADKIRALGRAGASPSEIGRFLGIRYQQAYNVLKRSGITRRDRVRDADLQDESAPTRATLDESGRLVLPSRILERWSVAPGDQVLVHLEGDELRVFTRDSGLRLARNVFQKYRQKYRQKYPSSGQTMAEELLAERRNEAKRDDD